MKVLQKEICFAIKRFTKVNSDFNEALKIYMNEMETSLKTDINEISFFVEEPIPENASREMYFLGLYYEKCVIGFSEIAFLKKSKTLMIDYFVIQKEFQKNGIFFSLFNLVLGYFHDIRLDYNYLTIEASKNAYQTSVTQKMLFYEDFKVVETLYYQPQLGENNIESLIECDLMLFTKENISKLKKETYLYIVEDIYYCHYLDWYEHFLSQDSIVKYNERLRTLISKIKLQIGTASEINLTLEKAIQCNYYKHDECHYGKTSGFVQAPKKRYLPVPIMFVFNIMLVSLFSYIAYIIMINLKIDKTLFLPILPVICSILTMTINNHFKK